MHATVSDILMDITQNSIEAGADIILVDVRTPEDKLEFFISDNGPGMNPETLAKATDPFKPSSGKHPGRRLGLGLPFVRQAAEAAGGGFEVASEQGLGTSVHGWFERQHPDAPPLGDLAAGVTALMNYPGGFELQFSRSNMRGRYTVSRRDMREALGELESAGSLALMKQYMNGLEESLMEMKHG